MPGSFFDSNVALYLLSSSDRSARAETLLAGGGVISVQVLNEVATVSRRKFGLSWAEAEHVLTRLKIALDVQPVTIETHDEAVRLAQRYNFAFYDAAIVAAALIAGCDTLWSEDMHDGLVVADRLTIRNPFTT